MAKLKIGDTPRRVEDARFVTGSGCYVDDLQPENLAHAAVVRARHAHAGTVHGAMSYTLKYTSCLL